MIIDSRLKNPQFKGINFSNLRTIRIVLYYYFKVSNRKIMIIFREKKITLY